MSTWFSWSKAAPGVMVEVIDAGEGVRAPLRAADRHGPGWKEASPRPSLAARPLRWRNDARRRRFP